MDVLVTEGFSWHFFLIADMEELLFMASLHSPGAEDFTHLLQIFWS